MLRRRLALLVATAMMLVVMAAPSAWAADGTPGQEQVDPATTGGRLGLNDSVSIPDMFDMQMKMNHLSQLTEV